MRKILGKDIKLMAQGEIFALATSCEISVDAELQEQANYTSGVWKKYKTKRKGWSLAHQGFVAVGRVRTAAELTGAEIDVEVTVGDESTGGKAVVQNVTVSAQVGNLARYAIRLQGNGELG